MEKTPEPPERRRLPLQARPDHTSRSTGLLQTKHIQEGGIFFEGSCSVFPAQQPHASAGKTTPVINNTASRSLFEWGQDGGRRCVAPTAPRPGLVCEGRDCFGQWAARRTAGTAGAQQPRRFPGCGRVCVAVPCADEHGDCKRAGCSIIFYAENTGLFFVF